MVLGPSQVGHHTSQESLVIIIPPLLSPLIISIPNPIPIVLHIIAEPLHIPNLLAHPASNILGSIFDVVHGVIPLALDAVAEAIEILLHVLRDLLGFAYAAAGPLGGVGGEVGSGLLEAGFVFVPVLFCGFVLVFDRKS
jgi:hypothetical protein